MTTKSKPLTVLFSFIPGAGHMYLGLINRGTQLMTLFFFSIFLIAWLGLELLGFVLPVIWFYSFFDALHCLEDEPSPELLSFDGIGWIRSHPTWIGWGLIVLGIFVVFEQGVSTFIPWEWHHYIQTGLVSLILIAGGIKLLAGSKAATGVREDSYYPATSEPGRECKSETSVKEDSECDNGE